MSHLRHCLQKKWWNANDLNNTFVTIGHLNLSDRKKSDWHFQLLQEKVSSTFCMYWKHLDCWKKWGGRLFLPNEQKSNEMELGNFS